MNLQNLITVFALVTVHKRRKLGHRGHVSPTFHKLLLLAYFICSMHFVLHSIIICQL